MTIGRYQKGDKSRRVIQSAAMEGYRAGVLLLLAVGALASDQTYLVNNLMDESLKALSEEITATGDVTAHLTGLSVGGWALRGARLADLTTLRRAGDCWLWADRLTVLVNGSLSLGALFVVAEAATGPQGQLVDQPIVTVGNNKIDFLLSIEMDTKASCNASYSLQWPLISDVTVYPGDGSPGFDVSSFVNKYKSEIEKQVTPAVASLMAGFGDMCQGHRLTQIEVTKYNADHENMIHNTAYEYGVL